MSGVQTVEINVAAPQPYRAVIENGVLKRAGEVITQPLPGRTRVYVVTSAPIRKVLGETLAESLKGLDATYFEVPDGEKYKTLKTVEDVARKMVKKGADRKSLVIALGGGVVGDMAGFLASIYMRGIDFVQIPTTLLAQVDASIGGKTGVDLAEG